MNTAWGRIAGGLAIALLAATAARVSAEGAPDLSGTWEFLPQQSDDVRAKIEASLGSGSSSGDIRKDAPRLFVRDWLLRQAQRPEARLLTIEQSAELFKSGLGDDVRIYEFGREVTRQGPGGGLRKASVRREGGRLVVEEKAVEGSGHVVESYRLQDDGSLLVDWRLEHKSLRQPLAMRLVFRKARP